MKSNKRFHKVAKITLVLTYLVIIAGAVVRMTGSGMGCPDWPKCFGYYIPPTERTQLEWHPNHTYKKGQVIILEESLQVAKETFTSTSTFNKNHWETYTKHDYAVFNPTHTWVEYINRLFGALAGFATLILAALSFKYWKQNKTITWLSLFVVFAMGFQAWLGKTVVDSNLAPLKITTHMMMALAIVACILYIVYITKPERIDKTSTPFFRKLLISTFVLTLVQIVLGTQVRQFIDEQTKALGYDQVALWLENPTLQYYFHRSFSILVFALNAYLFYLNKKLGFKIAKLKTVMYLLILEVFTGIAMAYFDFPFSSQTLHLVLASILFGIQFYIILEVFNKTQTRIA